jgi:hypothetical protein
MMTTDVLPDNDLAIPAQRTSAEHGCHRCGATGVELADDPEVNGAKRCADQWNGCYDVWRPQCPTWCTGRHADPLEQPVLDGVWFHTSNGTDMIVGDDIHCLTTIRVSLCAFERVGGGLQTPTVCIGDDAMLPIHARALATALNTTADLADLTGATLRIGQAHNQPDPSSRTSR